MDEVIHKRWKRKFFIKKEGLKVRLNYKIRKNNVMDIFKTDVPEPWRGKGIGKKLVEAAIAFAKSQNYTIKPTCSFVKKIMEEIPDSGVTA